MAAYIQQEKQNGNLDIVIDVKIFKSYYHKFSDWGNIGHDKDSWPNTTYAKFFKINSIRVREN